jgi:hypothetical protein
MTGFVSANRRGLSKGDDADQDGDKEWFHVEMVPLRPAERKID